MDVPQDWQLLVPNWPHLEGFEQKDMQLKLKQNRNIGHCHRVHPLPPLSEVLPVEVNTQDRQIPGRVITTAATPRSYIVDKCFECASPLTHDVYLWSEVERITLWHACAPITLPMHVCMYACG